MNIKFIPIEHIYFSDKKNYKSEILFRDNIYDLLRDLNINFNSISFFVRKNSSIDQRDWAVLLAASNGNSYSDYQREITDEEIVGIKTFIMGWKMGRGFERY